MSRLTLSSLCSLLLAVGVLADGMVIFPRPYPTPLSVSFHKVTVVIDNGVAQTSVDQQFVNRTREELADGRYIFPVPQGASVGKFGVYIDGQLQQATVMDRDEAKLFFRQAVQTSNQAALLEYSNNQAYSLRLAAIPAGGSRRVRISYEEVLTKDNGLSRYLYPLNTEKFSYSLIDTVQISVSIRNQSPITSVYSPSHGITVSRTNRNNAQAEFLSVRSRPNTDFELFYKVSDEELSFHLFTYKEKTDDGYFLMLITPQYVTASSAAPIDKDMAFTIDRSGSMTGDKIRQAKEALTFCVNRLNPGDLFNIVTFSHELSTNSAELLTASADNVRDALAYVQNIQAGGNTDIAQALRSSLSKIQGSAKPHYVVFLTDGVPTAGQTNLDSIVAVVSRANTNEARIFSVGFGFDVNTVLIDRLSNESGGYALYCSPNANIQEVIADLYKRIETPLLTKPAVSLDGISAFSVMPGKLPDLFAGSEIAVYGRYRGEASATVKLTGAVEGAQKVLQYPAYFPNEHTDYAFVPRLWASQAIAALMSRIKLAALTAAEQAAAVDTVKALSIKYGIVTPYTAQIFTPDVPAPGGSWEGNLQQASGRSANDASNYMQAVKYSANAGQSVVQDTAALSFIAAPQTNQMQNAGDKVFVFSSDSVWVDAAYDKAASADTVYFGTEAYFGLVDSEPALARYLTVGNQAAVNYRGRNYVILSAAGGVPVGPTVQPATPAAGRQPFAARVSGRSVLFSGLGAHGARISVYAADGRLVARFTAAAPAQAAAWEPPNGVTPRGLFCAVLESVSGIQALRFTLAR